jgi:RNA polymerase sigma factor (sigma-70 family)
VVTLITSHGKTATPVEDMLALDEALEELAKGPGNLAREAQVVELYFFVGATPAEIARVLGVSERQVYRDYRHARAWLYQRLSA